MLKRIPKSDISIRPFKAYKEWDKTSSNASLLIAEEGSYASVDETIVTYGYLSGSSYNKHSVFGQLRAQFYNGNEDNPFLRIGNKSNEYNSNPISKERFLSNDAKVISIPQIYVGEGIKKGSVSIVDSDATMIDDSNGNLLLLGNDVINFEIYNMQFPHNYTFELNGTPYTVKINLIDLQNQILLWEYDGILYDATLITFDINTGDMVVDNVDFASAADTVQRIGNVFYNAGLIVMTRNSEERLLGNWNLSYKSTKTIYEHEYLLIVNEDEFNTSQNPSAVVEIGRVDEYITGSDGKIYKTTATPGVKYIRKKSTLENGDELDYRFGSTYNNSISGGFEQYDLNSASDSTGSYLLPFITTIGLYDDNCDLVAVAKLPQPIKSESDMPVNFIVRFDT
jgi:hypothetical protein